jgi:hypothetical protein
LSGSGDRLRDLIMISRVESSLSGAGGYGRTKTG